MNWDSFTPWTTLAGGAVIGAAASVLLVLNGRVAGISGVLGGLLTPKAGEVSWRIAFALGLALGGLLMLFVGSSWSLPSRRDVDGKLLLGAALFGVGWGLGGYCPGPGVVSLVGGAASSIVFVGVMLVAMALTARVEGWLLTRERAKAVTRASLGPLGSEPSDAPQQSS